MGQPMEELQDEVPEPQPRAPAAIELEHAGTLLTRLATGPTSKGQDTIQLPEICFQEDQSRSKDLQERGRPIDSFNEMGTTTSPKGLRNKLSSEQTEL